MSALLFETLLFKTALLFQIKDNFVLFSLYLSIIHNNLVSYTFVRRIETINFFPTEAITFFPTSCLQNLEILSEYSYFYGNMVICMNSVRICSHYEHN